MGGDSNSVIVITVTDVRISDERDNVALLSLREFIFWYQFKST